jgi:hypothetical protein
MHVPAHYIQFGRQLSAVFHNNAAFLVALDNIVINDDAVTIRMVAGITCRSESNNHAYENGQEAGCKGMCPTCKQHLMQIVLDSFTGLVSSCFSTALMSLSKFSPGRAASHIRMGLSYPLRS